MKRNLLLVSLPFLVLGSILLPVSIALPPPMTTVISNDRQNISHSEIANRYYYIYYSVQLSANQRAEFQFSSSQPVNFYIFDRENFDSYIQNQTSVVITSSPGESQDIHSFTPTRANTYVFMLLNISAQDASVTVSVRRTFAGLEYIGGGILVSGAVLMALGLVLKPRAVEIPAKVLEMIKMHGRILISELASTFSTSETDIELALLKIRSMNEPIFYDAATREVSYLPRPRAPETSFSPAPPAEGGS